MRWLSSLRARQVFGMQPWEVWALYLSNLLVAATGIVYGALRYFVRPADPFAMVHPAQPLWQHLHILTAPVLVFAVGLIWSAHALGSLRKGVLARRSSGLSLVAALLPMVLSGYFLQVSVGETWRKVWVVLHLAASLVWIAGLTAHLLSSRGRRTLG